MRISILTVPLTALLLLTPFAVFAEGWIHPYDFPQTDDAPAELYAVIEIPAGSFTKYEIDAETGHVLVDRFVPMPVVYPTNYGSIPQSLGGDGDPLDVLVITRASLHPGVLVRVRPIAVLKSVDSGEVDDKVLAVPAADIDPTYREIADGDDLPADERRRIEAFFRVYKQLEDGKRIEIKGWGGAAEAKKMVAAALDRYRVERSEKRAAP